MRQRSFRRRLEHLYRKQTSSLRVLPSFIIIGAGRSGTTSLFENLMRHPCAVRPTNKEPGFFNHYYGRGISWYRRFFPLALHKYYFEKFLGRRFVTGEATANYFFDLRVPERISKTLSDVRLILLLRNPIDRAYSAYHYDIRHSVESRPFEQVVKSELEILRTVPKNPLEAILKYPNLHLVQGLYIEYLQGWHRFYQRERLLILKSEDFFKTPSSAMKNVTDFIGLPEWEPVEYVSFKEPGKRKYKQYNEETYPRMNAKTREELMEFFEPYNQRLYDDLKTDFRWEAQGPDAGHGD